MLKCYSQNNYACILQLCLALYKYKYWPNNLCIGGVLVLKIHKDLSGLKKFLGNLMVLTIPIKLNVVF